MKRHRKASIAGRKLPRATLSLISRKDEPFQGLLEAAPDAIVIVNHLGVIVLVNSQTERLFGYSRCELLGKSMEILVPERFREAHVSKRAEFAKAPFERDSTMRAPLSTRHKDGGEFPVEISINPLKTRDGLLVICSIRDATERIKAELAISNLNSELEDRVNRRTAALRNANEKLLGEIDARHRLEKEILEISEREQRRIGHDLHDDLGQRLVGISYLSRALASSLTAAASPEAAHAEKITGLLNDALSLTRSLARGLHPVALKSGGLLAALGDLAERTADIFQIHCEFKGESIVPCLCPMAATHIYRIAQEAVTNSVNHGKADRIRIELISTSDQTRLVVTDNGCGMPNKPTRTNGMGLRIMHYRADVISGSLAFSSPLNGSGTIITCTVPCQDLNH